MNEIISTAIKAIIDGIVNLFTASKNQRRKEQREDAIAVKEEQKEIFQSRPEMDIIEYKNYLSRPGYGIKQKCDIEIFVAHIDHVSVVGNGKKGRKKREWVRAHFTPEDLNSSEWCCVMYTLKNVGKTDISTTNIICNYQRDTCIFPCALVEIFIENNALNYSECFDKKIRSGATVSLKICYHKDRVITSMMSATLSIGMHDANGNYWQQPLFAPADRVYDSRQVAWKEYRAELLPDSAIECFKNPMMW